MKFIAIILCSVLLTCTLARDPRCPLDGTLIYFPHEYDCRLFYQCNAAGEAMLHECETGLEFHPIYLVSTRVWCVRVKISKFFIHF